MQTLITRLVEIINLG